MTNTKRLALLLSIVLAVLALAAPAPALAEPPAEVIALDVSNPALEELRVTLIEAGFSGVTGDKTDEVIYVPVWAVLDPPGGTWTITPEGPKRCVDWATTGFECTDGVYLPWHPDFIG